VPALTPRPMVTNRMINSAATSLVERTLGAQRLLLPACRREKAKAGRGDCDKDWLRNGADAERVSGRANQTTRQVANVNNS